MESMAADETANIIIVLERINANSTGVTWRCQTLRGQGGVDVVVVVIFHHALCSWKARLLARRLASIGRGSGGVIGWLLFFRVLGCWLAVGGRVAS
jgi:hypothetical protein